MSKESIVGRVTVVALLVLLALPLMQRVATAGGFQLAVDTPRAGDDRTKDAVLVVRTFGCHQPADAKLTAKAEGIIDGRRDSVPVDLTPTETGVYAIKQQWPARGSWVIVITGNYNTMTSSLMIDLAPGGKVYEDTRLAEGSQKGTHVRAARQEWTASQIDAALKPAGPVGEQVDGSNAAGTLAIAGVGAAISLVGFVTLRRRVRKG
jgi:hypothetical protein